VKHRAEAQTLVERGAVRVNKVRVAKPSHAIKADDILTLAVNGRVLVVRVRGAASRRGPASVASLLYDDISPAEKQDASGLALC
jgi:ribosome-associated heat shock protein Hsp15